MTWIMMTLLAATCQTVRTALQKELKQHLSDSVAANSRFFFAWPFSVLYCGLIWFFQESSALVFSTQFVIFSVVAAITQIIATWALVSALSHAQFAIAVTYSKLEPVCIAILGVLFFSQPLEVTQWLGIAICMLGLMVLAPRRSASIEQGKPFQAIGLGLLSAVSFAIASLSVREASWGLGGQNMWLNAAIILVVITGIQTMISLLMLLKIGKQELQQLKKHWRTALGVSFAGFLGSVGWFTAFSLQTVALVKVLGQIELIFSILLTRYHFREAMSAKELLGVGLIVFSVVLVLI